LNSSFDELIRIWAKYWTDWFEFFSAVAQVRQASTSVPRLIEPPPPAVILDLLSWETIGTLGDISPDDFMRRARSGPGNFNFVKWTAEFLRHFLKHVRDTICIDKKRQNVSQITGVTAIGAASGLAAFCADRLGVPGPYAIALGTCILLVLARATKGAFCKMTDEEILASLMSTD
jgi:hypothetical protein